jgi:hypothetical protein
MVLHGAWWVALGLKLNWLSAALAGRRFRVRVPVGPRWCRGEGFGKATRSPNSTSGAEKPPRTGTSGNPGTNLVARDPHASVRVAVSGPGHRPATLVPDPHWGACTAEPWDRWYNKETGSSMTKHWPPCDRPAGVRPDDSRDGARGRVAEGRKRTGGARRPEPSQLVGLAPIEFAGSNPAEHHQGVL